MGVGKGGGVFENERMINIAVCGWGLKKVEVLGWVVWGPVSSVKQLQ